jgi:hypothetical protein
MLGGIILAEKCPVPEVAHIVGVLNTKNKNHDDQPRPEQFSVQVLLLLFFFLELTSAALPSFSLAAQAILE